MKFEKRAAMVALACGGALTLASCDNQTDCCADDPGAIAPVSVAGNLAEVVAADPSFAVLVGALEAQGLNQRLAEDGPLTFFAPTDNALAGGEGVSAEGADPDLRVHLIEGSLDAEAIIAGIEQAGDQGFAIPTLAGSSLIASRSEDGAIVLTGADGSAARIEATDVEASNGLLHVIDGVLGTR